MCLSTEHAAIIDSPGRWVVLVWANVTYDSPPLVHAGRPVTVVHMDGSIQPQQRPTDRYGTR